jgi:hypothetical protein
MTAGSMVGRRPQARCGLHGEREGYVVHLGKEAGHLKPVNGHAGVLLLLLLMMHTIQGWLSTGWVVRIRLANK